MNKGTLVANSLIESVNNDESKIGFKEIDRFFPYTNENIRNYCDIFNFENKDVLTVCGSGDQVFNAVALGAKEITTFDINIVALYHMELKKIMIEHYSLETFLAYYMKGMKVKLYENVRQYLSNECKCFFDRLYHSGYQIDKFIFGTIEQTYSEYFQSFNPYLDEEKFDKLKEQLKTVRIKTICADIFKLNLNKKYDIMNFSNILNVVLITSTRVRRPIEMLEWLKKIFSR